MEVDEIESFQLQALEITPIDDNFDPSKQPQNGEEYLRHMLYERKKCPAVVVKRPKNLEQYPKNDSSVELELSCSDVTPDGNLLPTIEWKNIQSCNFIRTRSKILMLRQHLANYNYDNTLEPPLITDDLAWLKFCQEQQPLLSLILRFSQRSLEQLLAMLSDWLKGFGTGETENGGVILLSTSSANFSAPNTVAILDLVSDDRWLGDWIYAVLACLHLPLEPNVHSILRDIARTCMQYRSRLKSDEFEKALPYNLFIYLIGKIFDQLDLLAYV